MLSSIICRMKACSPVKNEQSRASSSFLIFPRITPRALSASTFGSRSPAAIARSMSRPDTPWMSLITDDSFRCPSSSSFSQRSFCAVRIWTSLRRYRVCVRSRRISSGGTKLPASDPCSVIFASQTESSLSVFGRPGRALTCDAWYKVQSKPSRSSRK